MSKWDYLIQVMLVGAARLTRARAARHARAAASAASSTSAASTRWSPARTRAPTSPPSTAWSGLTRTIALETAGTDITINTICPSYVKTPLVDKQIADQARTRGIPESEVDQGDHAEADAEGRVHRHRRAGRHHRRSSVAGGAQHHRPGDRRRRRLDVAMSGAPSPKLPIVGETSNARAERDLCIGVIPNRYSCVGFFSIHDVLYHLHDYHRALFAPPCSWREATARMFSSPGQLAGAPARRRARRRRVRALLPARQARTRNRSSGSRRSTSRGARVAVLEETALARPFCRLQRFTRLSDDAERRSPRLQRRSAGAGGGAAVRSPLHAAARDGRDAAHATTTSTSPTGSTRAWCPPTRAPSRSTTTSATSARSCGTSAPERLHVLAVCQPAVPVLAAAALSAAAGEPRAAQPDPDGRADRHAPQPDPGQPLRHQPAAALVRDQPAPRGAARLSGARPRASIPASCSTPASSR